MQATCEADAGTLGMSKVCLNDDDTAVLSAGPNGDAIIPDHFVRLYVLTSGEELVIRQVSPLPSFEVEATGLYTIHTLVYNPETLDLGIVDFGQTTGFDVNGLLIQGGGDICASLDVAGVKFAFEDCQGVCNAFAGTLKAEEKDCFAEGQTRLAATHGAAPLAPEGFTVAYVLTSGDELVIQDLSDEPSFVVDGEGRFTIHTLVYDPETLDLGMVDIGATTGFDVNSLLVQGGGDICAALDVAGAPFEVEKCTAELACKAEFGELKIKTADCIEDGQGFFEAEIKTAPTVPDGFQTLFVLTSGDELIIENVSDAPAFDISEPGKYTIHTLVYDPETLDLGIVEVGVTTGFDVNGLLLQGGGDICAVLDVAGVSATFKNCKCEAEAGRLLPRSKECIENGKTATIKARRFRSAVVPSGFSLIYVLTSGTELVIENVANSPEFEVGEEGLYTIHTLVYDPETLDLGIVEFGKTTGFDVNGLLVQGGGDICGALDVRGAKFLVEKCDSCNVTFGQLKAKPIDCLKDKYDRVKLSANLTKNPTGPRGFKLLFVLTKGEKLVIQQVSEHPEFYVDKTGLYTIHTLVYDPKTLDLGIVEFGKTSGFDVNGLLVQGGGDICAALDVEGAKFRVERCGEECKADFGAIAPKHVDCYDGRNWVKIEAKVTKYPVVPRGYRVIYVVTTGEELTIQAASYHPVFYVKGTGRVTIHTLVYNPHTLDLRIIKAGKTTGGEVNSLLIQGGGDICAALDVEGASFHITSCGKHLQTQLNVLDADRPAVAVGLPEELNAGSELPSLYPNLQVPSVKMETGQQPDPQMPVLYPNPATNAVQLDIPSAMIGQNLIIDIMDTNGQLLKRIPVQGANARATIDVSDLTNGMYNLRINTADGEVKNMLFSKFSN